MYLNWVDQDGSWQKTNLVDDMRIFLKPEQESYLDGFNNESYGPYRITIEKVQN